MHLFGRTATVRELVLEGRAALGSDSRLSGERDLLAELRLARELTGFDDSMLESLVTDCPARLLRMPDRGALRPGALADLLVLPADLPLSCSTRADIRLVLLGGKLRYSDPDYAEDFGCDADADPVRVDGRAKYLARSLIGRLSRTKMREPGLEVRDSGSWS